MTEVNIHKLIEKAFIDPADWQFAKALQRIGKCDDPWVGVAAALVNRWTTEGHVCLDLSTLQREGLKASGPDEDPNPLFFPKDWLKRLSGSPVVGEPGAYCPLILDDHRLYPHRYWTYEQNLAHALLERCTHAMPPCDPLHMQKVLAQLFPEGQSAQRAAAQLAATQLFSVITGGPGTGKTYTVAKIIVLLLRLYADHPLSIHLAAPTGKAAARLQESVENLLKTGDTQWADAFDTLQSAQTLHRLLGYMPSAATYRFNADQPLSTDAVIVDEASMIDLALMHQLVQAVPRRARLILVGDKDQLASVEAGAVLGDICHGAAPLPNSLHFTGQKQTKGDSAGISSSRSLAGHIATLDRGYRFDDQSGISTLGRAIHLGDAEKVLALFADRRLPAMVLRPLDQWPLMPEMVEEEITTSVAPIFDCHNPSEAFTHLNRFKILTAVRKGPFGAEAMNHSAEDILRKQGRIAAITQPAAPWYHGRPVMITRNDYYNGLFNGDVGIAMGHTQGVTDEIQVVFPGPGQSYKYLAPHQLTQHQTVYAMTIHKSQGSEFDRIMIVLPDEDMPLLTRELIYTAVTRARKSITIWADPQLLARAVGRPIRRASGLRKALWL